VDATPIRHAAAAAQPGALTRRSATAAGPISSAVDSTAPTASEHLNLLVSAGVLASPVLSKDGSTIYVNGRDERLWALHAADGKPKWSVPLAFLAQTPPYDHCTMTAGPFADDTLTKRFGELLLGMDYGDQDLRPLLDLEGLKQWLPPRLEGYAQLERAVDEAGFYDAEGAIRASDYRP